MGRFLKRKKRNRKLKADLRDEMEEQQIRAKFSKKNANKLKKIYGKLSPEEVNAMNELTPVVAKMAKELKEQGVDVNPDDPIQVASVYDTEVLDGAGGTTEADTQDAYYPNVEQFENSEHMEHVSAKAKDALKAGFAGVSAGILSMIDSAKDRKRKGEKLSPEDKNLLKLDSTVTNFKTDMKKKEISKITSGLVPMIVLLILAYVALK